ncbi:MAG: MarR family transcriptional regulator [Algoriphagus sp.]|uniref:MarR family winged helix-turn-helix transcriptional regulator n=1 Tax=Algoriphagus sp. TaxID=1872435 RepID=UPI002769A1FE|nr:MarR family transcriptional regulator [Algoriphagus sp.]MDP4904616.1 MarR family transcriptional regulator [Algoriphagus sp.]MDP5125361.1 MarR family transcriptional regulator [Algoriphagus sp.]
MGKIEEAIKQSEFKDSYNKVVVNLLYTHSYLVNFQTAVLKPMDLSPEQYNVLRILRGHQGKPATIAAIQERMLNTMSNASRLVDKLKIKGLVKREECLENRRKVDVLITDKGLQLLESLEPQIATANKKAVQLEENEVAHLNNLLDKLRG